MRQSNAHTNTIKGMQKKGLYSSLITALLVFLLSGNTLYAQKNVAVYNPEYAPPLKTVFNVAFHAEDIVNPGVAINVELPMANDWLAVAETAFGYDIKAQYDGINAPYSTTTLSCRWMYNRDAIFRNGGNYRKNSGGFLEAGVLYAYKKRVSYFGTIPMNGGVSTNVDNTIQIETPQGNHIVDFFLATGYRITARSNVYFSGKLGVGYGVKLLPIPSGATQHRFSFTPIYSLQVGYSF